MHRSIFAAALAGVLATSLPAQEPYSLGQPPIWRQHVALTGTLLSGSHRHDATIAYGVFRPISKPPITALNPVLGVLGGTLEGYGSVGSSGDAGLRALLTSRLLALSIGADWDVRNQQVNTLVSWQSAIRRGGLLGHGSMLRVDWLPARDHTLRAGVSAPLFQPLAGRTRPRATTAKLPSPPPAADVAATRQRTDETITRLADALRVVAAYSNLWTDEALRTSHAAPYLRAMQDVHDGIQQLFTTRLGSEHAAAAARAARRAVLERLLIPVDSLFGMPKDIDVARLERGASAQFSRWLADSSGVPTTAHDAARSAFAAWLGAIAAPVRDIVEHTPDSRLVWLPLDFALALDEYDDQIEVDSLIGRVVGRPFTDRNALTYMRSTDLPIEIARSIFDARDYHVLWTHEFMGRFWNTRALDDIGYQMVADAYLPALTAAVKRYDSTGVLPTYMILHDQFFYETSDGRLWLTILENPLNASMQIEGDDGSRGRYLRERQAELRAAVAGSQRLQRDAAAGGDAADWLRRRVKVHVNVTHPSDFSFRSRRIIPGIPFTPDNLMRDHRKLVIYDVNEAEPNRGAMFVMGIGIGEVYSSATWDDRGYRVRGPVTLEARAALRRVLRGNGFTDSQIPVPLREMASTRAQERSADQKDFVGRALMVNNEVGFGDKKSSVARAILYNLSQAGGVIVVPDQLWYSETWAGMLAGAAARGVRVSVIAPAEANAPVPDAPAIARTHDVLLRLLHLRQALGPQMRASRGDLRVGLFAAQAAANDAPGRIREVREGLARSPWIREVIPFGEKTLAVLERVERETVSDGRDATDVARDEKPKPPQPHRKTQLVARAGAITALLQQPGWDEELADAMRVQSRQTASFAEQLAAGTANADTAATRRADEMLRGYEASIPETDRRRMSFYFAEGSQNMNDRSLMSDGEVTLLVSGPQASVGLVDLFYMMARTTWIDTRPELDRLLPPRSRFVHWFARKVRAAL